MPEAPAKGYELMSAVDIVIIAAVVLAVALIAKSFIDKSKRGACSGCSSEGTCDARETGCCSAAEEMVADARAAVARSREDTR